MHLLTSAVRQCLSGSDTGQLTFATVQPTRNWQFGLVLAMRYSDNLFSKFMLNFYLLDTYRNFQRHRAVLVAIARLSCFKVNNSQNKDCMQTSRVFCVSFYVNR